MIITIGRQHGSNGHAVAETLAKRLNIPCYSKEIVDRTARDSNFSHEVIRSYDEKRISPFMAPSTHFFGMDEGFRLNMQIASAQFDAIRSLAEEGDAVFVGRCADYVLRSREDLVRVFLLADMPYRIRTVMERKDLTPDQVASLVIAYEPIWAIGTGKTATSQDANETIGVIRAAVREVFGAAADEVRIQYGGSMNPKNATELMAQPEIDGGLIGGASLKAEDFSQVVKF